MHAGQVSQEASSIRPSDARALPAGITIGQICSAGCADLSPLVKVNLKEERYSGSAFCSPMSLDVSDSTSTHSPLTLLTLLDPTQSFYNCWSQHQTAALATSGQHRCPFSSVHLPLDISNPQAGTPETQPVSLCGTQKATAASLTGRRRLNWVSLHQHGACFASLHMCSPSAYC